MPVAHDDSNLPSATGVAAMMGHWADPITPGINHQQITRKPGEAETVAYLGLNDASREKERSAFAGMKNATLLTGSGTKKDMQGKMMAADGKTVLDLSTEEGVHQFLNESGAGKMRMDANGEAMETPEQVLKRMDALEELFLGKKTEEGAREGGLNVGARDEMAGFVKHLQKVETGQATMDRVVMSGHSTGEWVYSEADGSPGVTFDQMADLMGQFPEAQAGVQDLMLSACHTLEKSQWGDTRDGAQYQDIFTNVTNTWGYNGVSPSYKQGSVQHIRNWLKASQGDDTSKIQQMARRTGQNATAKIYED